MSKICFEKKEVYSASPLFKIGSLFCYLYEMGYRISYLKCQKYSPKKEKCIMHHHFSKSGHFFATSTKQVIISVHVSKFTLFITMMMENQVH